MNFNFKVNIENLKYKKFKTDDIKVLLITSKYFLIGEVISAFNILGIKYEKLILGDRDYLTEDFLSLLTSYISSFKPDFTFTINHLGVDREGILMDFFEKIEMPLLSWYVDNPNLIIKYFRNNVSDFCTMLVWDKDNVEDMKQIGFKNVFYLPLGCDTHRFRYIHLNENPYRDFQNHIVFVGNSMIEKVKESLLKIKAPDLILKLYKKIAVEFANSDIRDVGKFIELNFPEFYQLYEKLDEENKTKFETTVTYEATRIYRYKCVKEIVKFKPLIVGDRWWKRYFRNKVRYYPEISYYDDLPYFYNLADINFNTTSIQMKNAVNQRVFDVPACRRFLITDYREQMLELFEPEKEVIFYKEPSEIPYLVEKYSIDEKARENVVQNAYRRVVSEHKYIHRALSIIDIAKKVYKQ